MDAESRYRSLAAMGIPLWLPRARLPGGPADGTTWQVVTADPAPAKAAPAPGPVSGMPRWTPPAEPVAPPRTKEPEPAPVAAPETVAPVPVQPEADAEPLHLQVEFHWVAPESLLVVESGGRGHAQFISDLVLSFGDSGEPGPGRFQWPPSGREALARRHDLARDALGGFAEVRCDGRGVQRIIVAGNTLHEWLGAGDSPLRDTAPTARLVVIPPLASLIGNPSAKRAAWETLCHEFHAG